MLYDTLSFIGQQLNKQNITWGIGGSVMLKHYGIKYKPNHLDIFIDPLDIENAVSIMNKIGEIQNQEFKDIFATTYYYKYIVNHTSVVLIADMKIVHGLGTYTYDFGKNSIYEHMTINHIPVPITALEDWFIIYQLIPNEENTVSAIETYFEEHDIQYTENLQKFLNIDMPLEIKARISNTIRKTTYGIEQIKKLPNINYSNEKFAHHFKMIETVIYEFDSSFDNTVVDTRAFYQVIKSDEIVNAVYYYMYNPEFRMKNGLLGLKKAISEYTIYEVKKLYETNGHSVFNPKVYYDYVDKLINRIEIIREEELSLESMIQTKLIYDRINEMNSLLTSAIDNFNKVITETNKY